MMIDNITFDNVLGHKPLKMQLINFYCTNKLVHLNKIKGRNIIF